MKGCASVAAWLLVLSAVSLAGSYNVSGTVLDSRGKPAPAAVIAEQWGPEMLGAPVRPLSPSVTTDSRGQFSFEASQMWNGNVAFLIFDSAGRESALVNLPLKELSATRTFRLAPLHSVAYRLKSPAPIGKSDRSGEVKTLSGAPLEPLYGDRGTVSLPPGNYRITAGLDDTRMSRLDFTVAERSVILAPVALELSPMAQHYGHGTPALATLRNLSGEPFAIGSLHGKWTLIYFWATWCQPCVQVSLPKLIAFAEANAGAEDRFRIVAVHEKGVGEDESWQQFHDRTVNLERDLWHTNMVPFPLVYDETTQMTSNWGIRAFPTYALIDPNGDLVRGGSLAALEAKLKTR